MSESRAEEEPRRESGQGTDGNSSPSCSRPELGGGNSMDGKTMFSMFPKLYRDFREIETTLISAGYEESELI